MNDGRLWLGLAGGRDPATEGGDYLQQQPGV